MSGGLQRSGWSSRARLARLAGATLLVLTAIGAAGASGAVAGTITQTPLPSGMLGITPNIPPTDRDLNRIQASGAATIRYGLSWVSIQSHRTDPFNWRNADRFMLRASRYGLSVDLLVSTTPRWAASDPNRSIWDDPLATSIGQVGWVRFIRAAVHRYGHGGTFWHQHPAVKYRPVDWTIWNEPNLIRFWADGPSAPEFAQLMNLTGPVIRAEDAKAHIIAGGVFCQFAWQNYLTNFYRTAHKSSFDDVAIHPYEDSPYGAVQWLTRARKIMDAAGDTDAGLWVDEISWGTDQRKKRFVTSPQNQAENIRILFQILAYQRQALNLKKVLWYGIRDYPGDRACQFCASSGLWRADDATPKPSWFVFKGYGAGAAGSLTGSVFAAKSSKPLADEHVYLDLNDDGVFQLSEPVRTTGADGKFSFSSLYPTTYQVRVLPQPGYRCAEPATCERTAQAQGGHITAAGRFTIAPQVPNTQITKKKISSRRGAAMFRFQGAGAVGPYRFQCKLDRGRWHKCGSPKRYKHLKHGRHSFRVRAVAPTGSVDRSPAKKKFRI